MNELVGCFLMFWVGFDVNDGQDLMLSKISNDGDWAITGTCVCDELTILAS